MPETERGGASRVWHIARVVLPPLILGALVVIALREPIDWWLHGEEIYDQQAMKEWIREARVFNTLPELVEQYLDLVRRRRALAGEKDAAGALDQKLAIKREEMHEHLSALGNPPTRMYPGQLPLFPIIYRLQVEFETDWNVDPIAWDSQVPRHRSQFRVLSAERIADGASVRVEYHLHAYLQKQFKERQETTRRLWLSGLGILFVLLALGWIYVGQRRERQRHQQRQLTLQQVNEAERQRLEEELRRQEAERRHEEAEKQNLELKSRLFANIGIMAGSYAHNIKNLLVRPNDLLRRCLEDPQGAGNQAHMLHEVQQTLGTVTERLQQILQTVSRDPSRSEMVRIDLNAMVREMQATWAMLAREKWKLIVSVEPFEEGGSRSPLWIQGDVSHLQQALENLLFNARDATFELRNHLREEARKTLPAPGEEANVTGASGLDAERRQAMIAAAGWKGHVKIRTKRMGSEAMLEVEDNGIGMTEEVRRRCIDTHFSTKRDNALFAGLSAGMGLGLSFVTVILDHHRAKLEIESLPLRGTTFRVRFPIVG